MQYKQVDYKCTKNFYLENMKKRDHVEDLGLEGMILSWWMNAMN